MFRFALVFFLFFLVFSLGFSAVIVYHLLTLGVQGDRSRKIVAFFVLVIAILLGVTVIAFFAVPWNALLDEFASQRL